MITINVTRVARQKGIAKPHSELVAMGITRKMATYYLNGYYTMIKLADLEIICTTWHCTPNDILEWKQDPNLQIIGTTHPLIVLDRSEDSLESTNQLLRNAPLDKIKEFRSKLKGEE